jgi:hypothetical protein
MIKDDSKHECCFCGKSVPSPVLVTLAVFIGEADEQDGAQAIFGHKKMPAWPNFQIRTASS